MPRPFFLAQQAHLNRIQVVGLEGPDPLSSVELEMPGMEGTFTVHPMPLYYPEDVKLIQVVHGCHQCGKLYGDILKAHQCCRILSWTNILEDPAKARNGLYWARLGLLNYRSLQQDEQGGVPRVLNPVPQQAGTRAAASIGVVDPVETLFRELGNAINKHHIHVSPGLPPNTIFMLGADGQVFRGVFKSG